jgi:hypothetical protein
MPYENSFEVFDSQAEIIHAFERQSASFLPRLSERVGC